MSCSRGKLLVALAQKGDTASDPEKTLATTVHEQEMEKGQSEIINLNRLTSVAEAVTKDIVSCTENFTINTMTGSPPFPESMENNEKISCPISESQLTNNVMEPDNIVLKNNVNAMQTEVPNSDPEKMFTELQPLLLPDQKHYYRTDSPLDDSDIDPDYDPEEEISPRAGKRKKMFSMFRSGTNSDSSDIDIRLNNGDDPAICENEGESNENLEPKKKRARTEKEKTERNLKKYKLLPVCNCKRKCFQYFSNERRQETCESFWKMNFGERRQYLNGHVKRNDVKYRKVGSNNNRQCSLSYNMVQEDGVEKQVCKTMFLNTHGLKTDGMITELKRQQNISQGLNVNADNRGRSIPTNKKDSAIFKQHINSFQPQVSHYNLSHAPNRRYLPSDLNVTQMWKDFCEKYEPVSYEKYRHEFNFENIGFDQPTQDDCDVCTLWKEHERDCNKTDEVGTAACSICITYNMHHELYTEARIAYQADRDGKFQQSYRLFSVDMQKILLLPKMSLKSSVFISRLVIFNETFAALNKPFENICVLWHEGISGRNAEDVASSYCAVIQRTSADIKHYIFWCDNCSAQNKNWKLYAALTCIVNAEWGPTSITVKYFEAGHTFMKADTVHGQIGKAWKKKNNIYDIHDLNELILQTSRQNKTLLLNCNEFYQFKEGCRQRRKKDEHFPKLSDVKIVEFRKGSKTMFYKKRHIDSEFLSFDFLRPKFDLSMPRTRESDRGVNDAKKQKILTDLVSKMPAVKWIFWENLSTSKDSSDLLSNQN